MRCQHRTNNEKTFNPDQNDRRLQNCDCLFYLVLKNINLPGNIKRTEVTINHHHTHPTKALEALSFREISEDSKVKLNCLFELGYSPSKAFHEFSLRLKAQFPDPTVYQLIQQTEQYCQSERISITCINHTPMPNMDHEMQLQYTQS